MSISIRSISSAELAHHISALVELLRDTVNSGSALGFLPPLTFDEGRKYWQSIRPELQSGSRLLLAAFANDVLVGTGQLMFASAPNAHHRAELQKLFVSADLRGQGIGRSLMAALHNTAQRRGRSLLLLNTRRGEPPEYFYKELGYKEVGVIPGNTAGPAGERYDTTVLYHQISLDSAARSASRTPTRA